MNGRVVVVTGSSRGIGRALAVACARRGALVVVHGRDVARIDSAVASIREMGGEAIGIAADLGRADGATSLIGGALDAFGRIDVLVNSAAVTTRRAPLWELDPDAVQQMIATNAQAPMLCAHALLAWAMRQQAAVRIVNVSSGIVDAPRVGATGYVASKAALEGFTRALALDVRDAPVVVTAVALTGHATEMARTALAGDPHAALAPVEDAVTQLIAAIMAPGEEVHGRVTSQAAARCVSLDIDGADLFAQPATSPAARAALATVAREGALERYPEAGCPTLRKLLAARLGVALDAVVIGGGTSELLDRVLGVALRPGDTVVANAPSWPLWPYLCERRRLGWRAVPYRIANGFADQDLDAIANAIDRSVRAVYLSSPGNPTGRALDAGAFAVFLDALPRHVAVIVDEAYAEYVTRDRALSAIPLTRWTDRPLVVLRTFSKAYALAGLRISYAVATPALALALAQAAPPFPVVRGAEEAASAALSDVAHLRSVVERTLASRARLEQQLTDGDIAWLASDAPFLLAATWPGAPRGPRYFAGRYVMLPAGKETDV